MWKCRKKRTEPVEITFHVPVQVSKDDIGISKIAIWNYNRKLNVRQIYRIMFTLSTTFEQ